jgi:hypothetical protein
MAELKWVDVEPVDAEHEVTVMASRFELTSRRYVPGFLNAALAIRRQVRGSRGALGVSLIAQPVAGSFWTLSAWATREALDEFVGQPPHSDTMAKYRPRMRTARFEFWSMPAARLPVTWAEARARLAAPPQADG